MRLTLKQLKSLAVETASGVKLGHTHDIILDTNGQMIAQYSVKQSIISPKEYLISRDQIVKFENEKIIVEDSAVAENKPSTSSEPVAMSESA